MLLGCCAAVILFACLSEVQGLTCYSCSDYDFDGEPDRKGSCFEVITGTSTSTTSYGYCRTVFNFEDGMVVSIQRSLVRTTSMMPQDSCHTTIQRYSWSSEVSRCIYACNNTDKCNGKGISSLKICKTNCRRPSYGYCDYITGTCACRNGYGGDDCSIPPSVTSTQKRKCVQCNSEIDTNCQTRTVGTDCPGTEQYCSASRTSVFTPTKLVRTSIIRGCSSNFAAVDECRFTNIYSQIYSELANRDYTEFTCYSTCDKDGCNVNTPDGIVNGEEKRLMCVQCTSESGDCSAGRSICPIGSRYCKAKVKYVLSDSTDKSYKALSPSAYKILSVVRECATEPVTKGCTESKVDGSLSFKKVTCEETCQEDGCNVGWPARPKCIQCSGSSCSKNPGFANQCSRPYEKYCYIYDNGMEESTRESVDGYPRAIVRGCSYIDRGTGCSTVTLRDKKIQTCNYTCSTDGCNVGSGSQSPMPCAYYRLAILIMASSTLSFISSL